MRTNIDIDDDLMAKAMEAGGFKTKREAVEEGLRLIARRKIYDGLLSLRGQLQWDDSDAAWAPAPTGKKLGVAEPTAKAYAARPPRTSKQGKAAKGRVK